MQLRITAVLALALASGACADEPKKADKTRIAAERGLTFLQADAVKWRKERERRKAAESERDQAKGSGQNADDPERIRTQADQAATAKANQRIVRSSTSSICSGLRMACPSPGYTTNCVFTPSVLRACQYS